jgi:signal transduction histidine kinase
MKIPTRLKTYIQKNHIEQQHIAILKVDAEGKLLDIRVSKFKSNAQTQFQALEIGKSIESELDCFEVDYFKHQNQTILLPNIEFQPDVFLDIHIIPADHNEHFLIFEDNTQTVKILHKRIQHMNEFQLEKQSSIVREKGIGLKTLSILNFVVFKQVKSGYFQMVNSPPEWVVKLFTQTKYQKDAIDIIEHFAYLESFLPEATTFWESNNSGKTDSCLWTEVDEWGTEYFLQAYATKINQNNLLIIGPTDSFIREKRDMIQKAREKSLDFEKAMKQEKALKKLLKLKDQFVSVVSHDLRSPATIALSYFNVLMDDQSFLDSHTEKHNKYLKVIYNEMQNLIQYNEKVYSWMNLELGRITLDLAEINLTKLLESILIGFENKSNDKKIIMKSSIQKNLIIEADEILFRNVVFNLLGNALKFTPRNGTIAIEAIEEDNRVIVSIKDSGVGISEEHMNKIFGEYSTMHTEGTDGEKGTGLGLGICKKIIDAHGFQITFESKVGEGTDFRILI